MKYEIREMKEQEYPLLEDFLYEAIFVHPGEEKPPRSIVKKPELQVYVADFGRVGDSCLVALVEGEIVGAVWTRIMNDYGHVDDETPSFAISLKEGYRNYGMGTALMKAMLDLLRKKGYEQASLAVQKANYAGKMYQKLGFEIVDENREEYIMVCNLKKYSSSGKNYK